MNPAGEAVNNIMIDLKADQLIHLPQYRIQKVFFFYNKRQANFTNFRLTDDSQRDLK